MVIFQTLMKFFIADIPVIVTAFICMFCVVNIYLSNVEVKKRWYVLLFIEGFEHLIIPIVLFVILLTTNSYLSALFFHITLLLFLFGYIGFFVTKSRTKKDWVRILTVAVFTYFFVFLYPPLLIIIQLYNPINGWTIMAITILIFITFYIFFFSTFLVFKVFFLITLLP